MKNITQFFDQNIANELYNEISQPTVGVKHDNILLKIANVFWPPSCILFFTTRFEGNIHIFVLGHILNEQGKSKTIKHLSFFWSMVPNKSKRNLQSCT